MATYFNKYLPKIKLIKNLGLYISACTLSIMLLSGCSMNKSAANITPKNKSHIYSSLIKKKSPTISINEYVSRIGKKLILISLNPENTIKFKVSTSTKSIDISSNGSININPKILELLNDEATLAYVLAAGIIKLENNEANISSFEEDKNIINTLERAGYDPRVVVELQNEYASFPPNFNYNWVKNLSSHKINYKRIKRNKNYLKNRFNGLQRYKDRYLNIVKSS